MSSPLHGLLLVDKQPGMTSFDCIRSLKKSLNTRDLGHGGTLDKFASGLLPVFAGEGLKLARFFLESYPTLPTYWKTYIGVFELGRATETGDPEGAIVETRPVPEGLTREKVAAAMGSFVGASYEQMPPRYSAKKIGGERASDLVREGKEPELKAVAVTIREFECLGFDRSDVTFRVVCSKGTYVRSLALDLARRLDTVAYTRELRRMAVGDFSAINALTLEQIAARPLAETVLGLSEATSFLPAFELIGGELEQLGVGRTDLVAARLSNSGRGPGVYCAREAATARPVGLFELSSEKHATYLRGFK